MLAINSSMLSDTVRNDAYAEALKQVIVPNKTVVADIGSGTGYLSFLALKLGAKHCYLYERDPEALRLSKEIAKRSGFTNCEFIQGDSRSIKSPKPVDVVISETLGHLALEENTLESMQHALRFLKPGGTLVPGSLKQYVALVVDDRIQNQIDIWDGIDPEIDFEPARRISLSQMLVEDIQESDLYAGDDSIRCWDSIDFLQQHSSEREGRVHWESMKPCMIFGLAVWWTAALVPGIELTTSPFASKTHWSQVYLPLRRKVFVDEGDTVECILRSDSMHKHGLDMQWLVNVRSGEKLKQHVSMDSKVQ